ncbi:MAG: hypothetical protein ABR878_03815 [Roseiarcus sp.]|jgi:hypothetical protein
MNGGFDWLGWIKHLEFTAVAAVAIAIACVMIGQGAERYAASTSPSLIAFLDPRAAETKAAAQPVPLFNAVDYATTGSIKGQNVVISPCASQPIER